MTLHDYNVPYTRRVTKKTSYPDKGEVACDHCQLFGFLKLFGDLPLHPLQNFLSTYRPVAKGETLFVEDQPFHGLYAVKKGSFKSYSQMEPQGEQILGFHLPGELMGLESIQSSNYEYNIIAMEASSVCLMPFERLNTLGKDFALFQEQVIKLLLEQVKDDQRQQLLIGRRSAEERLGAFFLNLSERYAKHGFAPHEFRMPMLQIDIANYLGMTMETVSRTLRSFRENELLTIQGRRVRILNPACLQSITQYCMISQPHAD